MISLLWCLGCGHGKLYDPAVAGLHLWCVHCGSDRFTADQRSCPVFPSGWVVTQHDRRFLRSLRIQAMESVEARS